MENNPLAALSDQLADTVERASAFSAAVLVDGAFVASGVFWKPGLLVTSDHNLKKAGGRLEILRPDGECVTATVKGRASGVDLAILEVEDPRATAVPFRETATPARPGQLMLVTGRSLETGVNSTMGVVSAVSGPWRTWKGGQMERFIRLDVALFPGVNGGLVVDTRGNAIGIATNALSRIAGVVIPSETIESALQRILEGKSGTTPGYLGVGLHEVDYNGRKLPIVLSVMPGLAAETAGIVVGDILTSIGGRELQGVRDVWAELIEISHDGKQTQIGLIRGGQPLNVTTILGERPKNDEEE